MGDSECIHFLQWALPVIGLRWAGFRKVRRQVCRRIGRRVAELGLGSLDDYRAHLEERPEEWRVLERLCRVTISRFWRDRGTFAALAHVVLPRLAEEAAAAGTGSRELFSLAAVTTTVRRMIEPAAAGGSTCSAPFASSASLSQPS